MKTYDVIIVGAGAAGLMAAIQLKNRNKSVLILDMGNAPGRKIVISGGGKCNFTNLNADYTHYFGQNPQFTRSALNQWTPQNTLDWVKSHNISVTEREPGRYFCTNDAKDILNALLSDIGNTPIKYNTNVDSIEKSADIFTIYSDRGDYTAKSVIIATGGLSYPHLDVSNIGHKIAKRFGHKIEPIRPALCAMKTNCFSPELSGTSVKSSITINKSKIIGDLLFTHFGIGGPAIYRTTLFDSKQFIINFAPDTDVFTFLKDNKKSNGKKVIANILSSIIPAKLAHFICNDTRRIADIRDEELKQIANKVNNFEILNASPIGLQSAEVTFGGVSVDKISSKTMESKLCAGLYFAGEVMDITGDLGGYNLQWAFASGFVAGISA